MKKFLVIGNGNTWKTSGKPKTKKQKKIETIVEGLPISAWLNAGKSLIEKGKISREDYNRIKRIIDQARQYNKAEC